jgi:hypothetical protein
MNNRIAGRTLYGDGHATVNLSDELSAQIGPLRLIPPRRVD